MNNLSTSHESHSFNVNVASVLSIEKALILKELYSLCKYKLENKLLKHGLPLCYYSSAAMEKKFPYMKSQSIRRWILEMEESGFLYSVVDNKMKIDKTKNYIVNFDLYDSTANGFEVDAMACESWRAAIAQKLSMVAQNEQSFAQNEQAITSSIITQSGNTPPVVGEPPTSKSTLPLNARKNKTVAVAAGAENEPKELATVFDIARKELLGVSGMDWKQAKEHKNLKELVEALGRKGPQGAIYDLAAKKRYLRKFLEIASTDDFIKRNFTPSILYSMMNKIFTEYELKKQEVKPIDEMPYHQKFNHQISGFSNELAAKKRI